ncbi:hypothetical protein A2159_01690, partial [Candidatus Woesebacteria bacterium RBG_13_34_9]
MCGRYTLANTANFKKRFGIIDKIPKFNESYNISPSTINPVIVRNSPNRVVLMKWGLVPFWAKDPKIGFRMINARAEDISIKPSFRKPIRVQRCLVPSAGFYEWKKLTLEDRSERVPFYIKMKQNDIFSFAGIYDIWKDVSGHEMKTYAIITTSANSQMSEIHDRMPVILRKEDEDTYLTKEVFLEDILKLLKP